MSAEAAYLCDECGATRFGQQLARTHEVRAHDSRRTMWLQPEMKTVGTDAELPRMVNFATPEIGSMEEIAAGRCEHCGDSILCRVGELWVHTSSGDRECERAGVR